MMARMRSLAPWFIIAVGGLFVLFMVLSDSKLADIVTTRTNNVGSINGKDITYQEYSNLVEQYRVQQVSQTGQEIPETQMDLFRDQVWENLVSQKLMDEKMQDLGIFVTDEEIINAIQGPNPPDIIKQYFIDSTGNFNREAYDQAIFDPTNKEAMLQTEAMVREQIRRQKLTSFLNASVFVSDQEVKRQFIEQNVKMSAEYAFLNFNSIPDSTINLSDDELMTYYNENKDDYEIKPQRKIKYILFSNSPTKDDTASIQRNLNAIVEKLKEDTSSFKTYVDIYSDQPYSIDTTSLSLMSSEAASMISESNEGSIVGPVLSNEGYVVYKVNNILKSDESLVRASHILIKSVNDENDAKKRIDEIYEQLNNGADFAELAKEKSEDGSAVRGGDLGWFGKGQMVKEFEEASFNGKIGRIQKPIKTQFGYHIIKVTGKSNNKYVVEKIVNEIRASATTLDRAFNNAEDFSYIADKNGFEEEAEIMGYEINETQAFLEDSRVIPGLGSNMALVKFSFENGIGSVSPVFKVSTGYVVATVSEITKQGYKPFDEVSEAVERSLLRKKKIDQSMAIANNIKESAASSGDLNIATSVFDKAIVSKADNFTASSTIPGIGRDPAFAEAALKVELNSISGPIKSSRGSYLIKVTERTDIDSTLYNIQKNSLRDNLLSQKKNRVFSDWLTALKDDAEIEDNRYLFYR